MTLDEIDFAKFMFNAGVAASGNAGLISAQLEALLIDTKNLKAALDKLSTSLTESTDDLAAAVAEVNKDVKALQDKFDGGDAIVQADLDALTAKAEALNDSVVAMNTSIKAIDPVKDSLPATPPVTPPAEAPIL